MDQVVVFSGLGSDALFSDRFMTRVALDASTPAGQLLLTSCHDIFREEVLLPARLSLSSASSDFATSKELLKPPPSYQRSSVVQHSTLCLAHLLRYVHLNYTTSSEGPRCSYATGLCAGLIPAVAAATSSTLAGFLEQAKAVYRLALLIGLACDDYQKASSQEASAIFVESIMQSELSALIEQHRKGTDEPLYISSKLSITSFTLTGTAAEIKRFRENRLFNRKVKKANISSFYHNQPMLESVYHSVLDSYKARGLQFPSCADLKIPIVSTTDGKFVSADTPGSLLEFVLSCIFLRIVNWPAVNATLQHLSQDSSSDQHVLEVNNYGPGYGAFRGLKGKGPRASVRDVTFLASLDKKLAEAASRSGDIAIVGMAAELPDADDPEQFWENMQASKNSCSEIPLSRFDYREFYSEAKQDKNTRSLSTKWGNFLSNPFAFDSKFFAVSPREALSMDPQQRMMLKVAHRALESAGYAPDSSPTFSKETFACYIAAATNDYVQNLRDEIDVYYTPGTHRAFLSGKISYFYHWSGQSITVDTVCSSSMTAINQAIRALQADDCRCALVGGVNVVTSPDMYIGLDRAHFLSPSGQCKTFDSSADGYCRAEGCGAVVLKNLEDAVAENDQVLGVIRSSELNQSGNAASITHPHTPTQQMLLERLLKKANADATSVSVVEAHGTGTQAGDPVEVDSIFRALCPNRPAEDPLYITSHKANIGHCEAASGLIATIKMCLMFKHGAIPPQVSLKSLNPRIVGLESNSAIIPLESTAWSKRDDRKRRGIVNNFGASGSNGALLLEEPPISETDSDAPSPEQPQHLLCLSAKTEASLELLQERVVQRLSTFEDGFALQNFCYTLSARRMDFKKRIIAAGRDTAELRENLRKARQVDASKGSARAVFVFSGQGAQHPGMGRALMRIFKSFNDHVMLCHRLLQKWGKPSCLDIFQAAVDAEIDNQNTLQVQAFQSALFVLEVGLARLFVSWGVQPVALVGHSLGEYAALVIADVLSLEDALWIVSDRAQLLAENCSPGSTGMLAVNLSEKAVEDILKTNNEWDGLGISCDNSPTSCVVGGPNKHISALMSTLNGQGVKSTQLNIPFAYHTDHLGSISAKLTQGARNIVLQPPRVPVLLNAAGRVLEIGAQPPTVEYFAQHCQQKVKFTEGIADLQKRFPSVEESCWLEIGPHASILPMVRQQVQRQNTDFFSSLDKNSHPGAALAKTLLQMTERGLSLSWRPYFEDMSPVPQLVPAPGMPYQEVDYTVPYVETKASTQAAQAPDTPKDEEPLPFDYLTRAIQLSPKGRHAVAEYETKTSVLEPYVIGHTVCGVPLCPGSVFNELALSATTHGFIGQESGSSLVAENTVFAKPLVIQPKSSGVVITRTKQTDDTAQVFEFEISSEDARSGSSTRTVHCTGTVRVQDAATTTARSDRFLAESDKFSARVEKTASQILSRRTIYDQIFPRVVAYSKLYQSIDSLKINATADEAVAECTYPPEKHRAKSEGAHVADPVMMDTLLHAGGFLCNMLAANDEVFIGHSVENACLIRSDFDTSFQVRCSNISIKAGAMSIGDAIALDSKGVVAMIRGIHFQKLQLSRMSAALSQSKGPGPAAPQRAQTGPAPAQQQAKPVQSSSSPPLSHPSKQEQAKASKPVPPKKVSVDHRDMIMNIVSTACSVPKTSINMSMSLDELGIDSLMMLEMEESFRNVASQQFTAVDFEQCLTVGDIVNLVNQAGDGEVEAEQQLEHETSASRPVASAPTTETFGTVVEAISKSCGISSDQITTETELDDLGIDSLMMLELENKFHELSPGFRTTDLKDCRTVMDVITLVGGASTPQSNGVPALSSHAERPSSEANASTIVLPEQATNGDPGPPVPKFKDPNRRKRIPMSPETEQLLIDRLGLREQPELLQSAPPGGEVKPSIFLIHAGSGFSRPYYRLSSLLGRNIWAIHDDKLLQQHEPWESVTHVAQTYAGFIRKAARGQPAIISGWSFGGIIAYEVAKLLQREGSISVPGLLLVDPPPPNGYSNPRVADLLHRLFAKIFGVETTRQNALGDALHKIAASNAIRCADILETYEPTTAGKPPKTAFLYAVDPVTTEFLAEEGDEHAPYDAWLCERENRDLALGGWYKLLGKEMKIIDLPGNHYNILERDKVQSTSAAYMEACEWLERGN